MREGDELLVQVVKDPLGTKGARLSTHVSLPSRYLVYMPQGTRVGVSSRIESEEERTRLRELVTTLAAEHATGGAGGGYIVRTAAMGAPVEALHRRHAVPAAAVDARARAITGHARRQSGA